MSLIRCPRHGQWDTDKFTLPPPSRSRRSLIVVAELLLLFGLACLLGVIVFVLIGWWRWRKL